jgi:dipeptidyl aminopeptidase/acylaminoacyl peptidase
MLFLMSSWTSFTFAQEPTTYQTPPKAIADLIDAAPTPGYSISPDNRTMLLLDRPSLPGIEEVAEEELRLAGIRISPKTNGPSRANYFNGMKIKDLQGSPTEKPVNGLPANARLGNISWSPDGKTAVFLNTTANGNELWALDAATAKARRLTDASVNAASGSAYAWFSDSKTLIFKQIKPDRGARPQPPAAPAGPNIQLNEGKAAPVRTYQDLLKNQFDETLFEYFTASQLLLLDVPTGKISPFGLAGIFIGFSPSPDGNYVLVTEVKKPFSYIVPVGSFPKTVTVYDRKGTLVRQFADLPAAENIPKGFNAVATGPRSFTWRADKPASLYWVEAQDGGDPKKEVAVRDKMFCSEAPFTGATKEVLSFSLRYDGVDWGNDNLAMAYESWWQTRRAITRRWEPANPSVTEVIFDRSYEDSYNDPGSFESKMNQYGRFVLMTADGGKSLFLTGQGASPEGNRPFVDKFDLASKKTTRLWRSEAPYYEQPFSILDENKGLVLTLREANYEQPNFFLRELKSGKLTQVTHFPNPYEALKGVKKELIKYQRADGVEMTGTLYLPAGYNKERDGALPVLMWAYPQEYKSADAAGQVTTSPHEFIRTHWGTPVLWVTQGYAVFDDVAMPIVGEGDAEPNETFVEQLRANAEAAVKTIADLGVGDPKRVGVGGHSYGAFMTANLLAHTDLFAAGIARSGAYNRTLTPFGFQSEERSYWETPETYFKMSPFNYADKIKEPLLLIHGEADNNSGTFPIQSERMYAALKGHGATVRLVMLPHESHGYRAKESIMHMAWEMNEWAEKYVKNGAAKP